MENLQNQIEASIAERMGELKKISLLFIENQSSDTEAGFSLEMMHMGEMINDLHELAKMKTSLSRRQELLNMDDSEKEEFLEELFESELEALFYSASGVYKNFIEERSFEDG